jgi:hypothetical protein
MAIQPNQILTGTYLQYFIGEEGCEWDTTKLDWQDIKWCEEDNDNFNKVHKPIPLTTTHLVLNGFSEDNNGHFSKNCQTHWLEIIPVKDGMYPVWIQLPEMSFEQETEAVYGAKCLELFGKLDLNTSSLKTAQHSLLEDLNECYATFPKSGIMQNGNVYRASSLERNINEKEYTALPTPMASDNKHFMNRVDSVLRRVKIGKQIALVSVCQMNGLTDQQIVSLYEGVMTFPINYTELKAVETQ